MTLPNMTEFAVTVPRDRSETKLYKLLDDVMCRACGWEEITLDLDGETIVCAYCGEPICVLCGCVERYACDGGCSWILPGVCSTHDGDVRMAKLAAPATPIAALQLTN